MRLGKVLRKETRTLWNMILHRLNPSYKMSVVEEFHRVYMEKLDKEKTRWLGVNTIKCPFDLWCYQEIIYELRPDVVVESGTASGGSALFMATVCDAMGHGRIVTIDIEESLDRPKHPRITYIRGSSTSKEVFDAVAQCIRPGEQVMVVLDSDHTKQHVLNELSLYGRLVTEGQYLIVEDTHMNGHPIYPSFGPGPMEAVTEFLAGNGNFHADRTREKFLMSFNYLGYLKKTCQ